MIHIELEEDEIDRKYMRCAMALPSIAVTPSSSSSLVSKFNRVGKIIPSNLHRRRTFTVAHNLPLFGVRSRTITSIRSSSSSSALNSELKTTLDKVVTSNKVVLFMKGTKEFPQCGFSNTVMQILKSLNVPFETINILENEILRQGLKEYSSWPTFPQLYIEGEFFGGCDITVEAYKSGQLQEVLEKAMCS